MLMVSPRKNGIYSMMGKGAQPYSRQSISRRCLGIVKGGGVCYDAAKNQARRASEQPKQHGIPMRQSTVRRVGKIFLFIFLSFGCSGPESLAALASGEESMAEPVPEQASSPVAVSAVLAGQGRDTEECFQLRPGSKGRRCEPQSLPFARCRSGIDSCRLGHENGPLTWFACEKGRGNTSLIPKPGSILILAANSRRKMVTGHVAYVEEVVAQSETVYRLIFTHTNYDRRCSLETNIEAIYDRDAQTLDILGGAWQAWGKGLPVAGFILD